MLENTTCYKEFRVVDGKIKPFRQNKFDMMDIFDIDCRSYALMGDKERSNCGLMMEIVGFERRFNEPIVRFEDGVESKVPSISDFMDGTFLHPAFNVEKHADSKDIVYAGFDVKEHAFHDYSIRNTYYIAKCCRCGREGVFSPQEMLAHWAMHRTGGKIKVGHEYYVRCRNKKGDTRSISSFETIDDVIEYLNEHRSFRIVNFNVEIARGDDTAILSINKGVCTRYLFNHKELYERVQHLVQQVYAGS